MLRHAKIAVALVAHQALAQPDVATEPPILQPLWTIASSDCASVDADGEPWLECGFQSFALNGDGTRVLTASSDGLIQLWDEQGREVSRLHWPDEPGGASGFPNARVAIFGDAGVAVAHQNQLAIIDVKDGRVLDRRVLDAMMVEEMRSFGDRLLAEAKDGNWDGQVIEIRPPSAEPVRVQGLDNLRRIGLGYYVAGTAPPFTIYFADGRPPQQLERSCMPVDEHACFWRDMDGPNLYIFGTKDGTWRTYDTGQALDSYVIIHVLTDNGRPYALFCRSRPNPVPVCEVRELETGRILHQFNSNFPQGHVARDPRGVAEIRVYVHAGANPHDNQRALVGIAVDGRVRTIDSTGNRLSLANGLSFQRDLSASRSILFSANESVIGYLPHALFDKGELRGRRWLVPVPGPKSSGEDHDLALSMYVLPDEENE